MGETAGPNGRAATVPMEREQVNPKPLRFGQNQANWRLHYRSGPHHGRIPQQARHITDLYVDSRVIDLSERCVPASQRGRDHAARGRRRRRRR